MPTAQPQIMIIEDEPLIAADLAYMIEDAGFTPLGPFDSAAAAQAALETSRPEFVLLDLKLTDGDAFAIADRLKDRAIPFAICSVHQRLARRVAAYPKAHVIAKPFARRDVLAAISAAVSPVA